MAIRTIIYEEGTDAGYQSVEISYCKPTPRTKKFDTGNFVKDWYDAMKWIVMDADLDEPLVNSSSVDHFIMDGAPYDSAYMVVNAGKPVLEYKHTEYSVEFFIEANTKPTWLELKKLCDNGN